MCSWSVGFTVIQNRTQIRLGLLSFTRKFVGSLFHVCRVNRRESCYSTVQSPDL